MPTSKPTLTLADFTKPARQPLTSMQLRALIGTEHKLCPECGGGYGGMNEYGSIVCYVCNPEAYEDSKRFAYRAYLVQREDGKFVITNYDAPQKAAAKAAREAHKEGRKLEWGLSADYVWDDDVSVVVVLGGHPTLEGKVVLPTELF